MVLGGMNLIQSWNSFVYHLTARGGQFQHGKLTKDHSQKSAEWQNLMNNSTREFIRKWGSIVKHAALMYPIIRPKYDIAIKITKLVKPKIIIHFGNPSREVSKEYVGEKIKKREDFGYRVFFHHPSQGYSRVEREKDIDILRGLIERVKS